MVTTTQRAEVYVGRHPLLDAICDHLTAWYDQPVDRNPWGARDRRGWFGASSLKSKTSSTIKYSARRMMLEYLGLLPREPINDAMAFGSYFDMVTEAAMRRSGAFLSTQTQFFCERLRLRCTPDFVLDEYGFDVPGDIKALNPWAWKHPVKPDYDLRRAYYYRQFQAVMFASEADHFWEIGWRHEERDPFHLHLVPNPRERMFVRRVNRDDACIADIVSDLEYLLSRLPACEAALAAGDMAALELALPVDV